MFRPIVSLRTPSRSRFAEIFLFPGPVEVGVTGDNSYPTMFGSEWLGFVEHDSRVLRAYQHAAGAWVERTGDARLPAIVGSVLPADVRRVSGAFDQAARAIYALEHATEGVVRVTRWDASANTYLQNVTFAGTDPCVVMDASWAYQIPGSDVLLFYLSPDRRRLLCRVQRDVYAVERLVWDYGQPVILDRVLALPYRFEVLVSDAFGAPLPSALVSDWYPVPTFVRLAGDGVVAGGAYDQVAEALSHHLAVSGDGVVHAGLYESPFLGIQHDLLVAGDGVIASGRYRNVVTTYEPTVTVAGDGVIQAGAYPEVATQLSHSVAVTGDGRIIGGTYATP